MGFEARGRCISNIQKEGHTFKVTLSEKIPKHIYKYQDQIVPIIFFKGLVVVHKKLIWILS